MIFKVNDNGALRQFNVAQMSDLSDFITVNDVPDIQINGTSIINNRVANIPIGRNALGAVYIASGGSDGISISTNGVAAINPASTTQIKNSTQTPRPITPDNEDHATFYGLAKAAGDTTQASSSNAVGTYTEEAKLAIKTMLGTTEQANLVTNVSGTDPVITGLANVRYMCGEVYTISITPPSVGTIDVVFTSGSTPAVLTVPNTVIFPEWWSGIETNHTYEIIITDGVYAGVMSWATT